MRFKLVKKETIVMRSKCVVIRIMAVTDEKDFKDCKLLEKDTVKLQRQTEKNKFETFATAKDLYSTGRILEEYINMFTYGQTFARI